MAKSLGVLALILGVAAFGSGCTAPADEAVPPRAVEVDAVQAKWMDDASFEVAVEGGGEQGGCSMAEIREAQTLCGGAIHGCWKTCLPSIGCGAYYYRCVR